jgi:hypothetical protein
MGKFAEADRKKNIKQNYHLQRLGIIAHLVVAKGDGIGELILMRENKFW